MAERFRVMTYNVQYTSRDHAPTLDAIAAGDADLVLLQEASPTWAREVARRFADRYPHLRFHHTGHGAGDLGVLSRVPVVADQLLPPVPGGWFPAQRLVVETVLGPVQVLHLHLRPMLDGGDPVRGFLTTPPIRRREIETFWPALDDGLPTLVAGDLNEEHATGRAIAFLVEQGLRRVDPGALATWEFRGAWRGNDVHLRLHLDHILVDPRLAAAHAAVLDAGASDHRPVLAELVAGVTASGPAAG